MNATYPTTARRAGALLLIAGLAFTVTACSDDDTDPTPATTSTASGPNQDEKDLAAAVSVTEAYYREEVEAGLGQDVAGSPYATKDFLEERRKSTKDVQSAAKKAGVTPKGKPNRVIWVKPSKRGKNNATARVCVEQNQLWWDGEKYASQTPEGEVIKPGDRQTVLVSTIMEDNGWKVDGIEFEKSGCDA